MLPLYRGGGGVRDSGISGIFFFGNPGFTEKYSRIPGYELFPGPKFQRVEIRDLVSVKKNSCIPGFT